MRTVIIAALVGLLAAVVGVKVMGPEGAEGKVETAYERVKRTGVIRCGYYIWPPVFTQDANTGKLGGFWHEMVEKMAADLSLKVEWVEKVDFANMLAALNNGRYDAICAPFVPTPGRAREGDFTQTVMWGQYKVYARAGDKRFDGDYAKLNSPDVTIAVGEGDLGQIIVREEFPKAKTNVLPALTEVAMVMQELGSGKADATFIDPITGMEYDKKNPGKTKVVPGGPIRVMPVGMVVAPSEHDLRRLLNHAIQNLYDTGYMGRLADSVPNFRQTFMLLKPSYEVAP